MARERMRSTAFRYILYTAAGVFLFGILGSMLWRSCLADRGGQLATRAKLQNLRVVMAQISILSADGQIDFPRGIDELLDLMEEEAGSPVSRNLEDPKHPLVDGWGHGMRFEGDLRGYEIRSAGQDREFQTEDDIYLQGDADGEYIVDGAAQKRVNRDDFNRLVNSLPYQEPTGYYQVSLPGRYTVIPRYEGDRSEITFSYAKDIRVTISAQPDGRRWDPDREMRQRLESLRRGEDEMFREFVVSGYELAGLAAASGYKIDLEKETVLVREYTLMNDYTLHLSILIVTSGSDRQFIMDRLTQALHATLVIQ
ncbi:MAG: hypothetical protein GQ544_01925 [Candidatus Aminicenantes bacterium]|nr:hypothetical protein [Candidatus Aminicenantes bacterium]